MQILIIEENPDLARIWSAHLSRQGMNVTHAQSKTEAHALVTDRAFDVVILNADIDVGRPIALADYISYRLPVARIIFVTGTSFFSDGSIFALASNVHACVPPHGLGPPRGHRQPCRPPRPRGAPAGRPLGALERITRALRFRLLFPDKRTKVAA